jgi:hypothetical protein
LDEYPAKLVRHSIVRAIMAGILMGLAMLFVQVTIDRSFGHTQWGPLYSDVIVGMITAFVTGVGLRHYQAHKRADRARLRMIAEMNHHVRNALTAISLSVYAKNDPQLEEITRDSIQRIDWALREVLVDTEGNMQPIPPKSVGPSVSSSRRSA